MKTLRYSSYTSFVVAFLLLACEPQTDPKPDIGQQPTAADVTFTFDYDDENENIVHFTNTSEGFKAIWDFGNGTTAVGNTATASYPVKGDYSVKLTILTKSGSAVSTQVVAIAETNPLMLDIPEYNMLTGGVDALDGKTWIVDKETPGHLGVGPNGGATPEWYAAAPFDKNGKNLYDDEMTFKLGGFAYEHVVNEYFYANGNYSSLPGAIPENGGGDFFVPWTPQTSGWSLTNNNDGTYTLTVSNGEFLGYYHGTSTYTVLSLSNDEMHIRAVDPNGGAPCCTWYQRLIRKGFTRPVEAPEYKIEDMNDNFEGSGNVAYTNDSGGSLTSYDNPAPLPINTSSKVGLYTKANGGGAAFANVQINKDYKFDLRVRNKFKLKVFIPSYNDYVTAGGEVWQSYQTLQKMVSLKLQNSDLGGNAYTTQAEVKFTDLEMNKWLELEFDFSAFSTREDFDRIVIQLGGEGIYTGGIFFIDDFELLGIE